MSVQPRSRLYVAVITGLLASSYGLTSISLASAAEQTVEKKTRVLAGQTFTFVKIIDAKGNVRTEVSDGSNKLINEKDVPRGTAPLGPRFWDWRARTLRSGRVL